MAEHSIAIKNLPALEVKYADVEFEVRSGDRLLGVLGISRGNLAWTTSWGRRRYIEWEKLDQLSEDWTDRN